MNEKSPIKGLIVGMGTMAAVCATAWTAASACSCTSPVRVGSHTTITNAVRIVAEVAVQVKEAREAAASEATPPSQKPSATSTAASEPLVFEFGGLAGAGAVEDPGAQITNLRMTKSGMSYAWAVGGCEAFGAKDRSDYSRASACAFYWDADGGQWIGGRFDSISTSRTTRSWNNIDGGYGGWNAAAFWAAPKRAFCIVSRDGKRRTNLLVTEEPK